MPALRWRVNRVGVGGQNLWRYRVGDYRVVCQLKDDALVVLVLRIGHRKHVYG